MVSGSWLIRQKIGTLYSAALNYIMFSLVLYPPSFEAVTIALFAVAEGWLLLDIGWFVLFFERGISKYMLLWKNIIEAKPKLSKRED